MECPNGIYTLISVHIIALTDKLMRYNYALMFVYLVIIPEPVQYLIYALVLPCDLRYGSITYHNISTCFISP